ncbi:hypothetical protein LINPERHAP1_LOCUS16535 [Linum perenne]
MEISSRCSAKGNHVEGIRAFHC